jgi:hypothetical protein
MIGRATVCAALACLPLLGQLQLSVARSNAVCDPAVAIDLGTANLKGASLLLRLTNTGSSAVTLDRLAFDAADAPYFSITGGPSIPTSFAAGAPPVTFKVTLTPDIAGTYLGRLWVKDDKYLVKAVIDAAAEDPIEQPSFRIIVTPESLASGEQASVVLKFDGPVVKDAAGLLRLDFIGKGDPAIQFVSPGGRSVPFTIAAGEDTATFLEGPSIDFQSGSTAGTVILTATLGDQVQTTAFELAAAPVWVDSIRSASAAGLLTLSISGFDNTRSTTRARFTFLDSRGNTLAGPLAADVTEAFAAYFKNAELGGMFVLRAKFPVTGNANLIDTVQVELTNSAGVTTASAKIAE